MVASNGFRIAIVICGLAMATAAPARAADPAKPKREPATNVASAKAATKEKSKEASEVLGAIEELQRLVLEQQREILAQREALRQQAEKLAQMEKRVNSAGEERPVAPVVNSAISAASAPEQEQKSGEMELLEKQLEAMADSTAALQNRVTAVETGITATNRANDGRFRQIGNFRFSGDLRYRYEPFIQEGQTTRQRQRVRARLNVQGNVSATIFGGVTLATGTLDDPISTNQTLTGNFNRFNIGIDRIWMQWTPTKVFKGHMTLGAGKFTFPWIRSPLTFDNDLNPNGIYTRLNWDFKNSVFKGITLVGMELPLLERGGSTSATSGIRADGYDSNMAGGQIQTRWKFGSRVNFGTNLAYLAVNSPDQIAVAHTSTGVTGNQPITNCVRRNAANAVVGYCSKFGYLNWMSTMGITTNWAKWPVNLIFDFNNNVRATRVIQTGTAAPTGVAHNNERSAYWAEVTLGRMSEQKDLQFGWVFARIERDAVITAFNESDLRAGSNLAQHRFNTQYRAFSNVTLSYSLWLGHVVNAADPLTGTGGAIALVPGGKRAVAGSACNVAPFTGCKDNTLKRMQFDIIYSF